MHILVFWRARHPSLLPDPLISPTQPPENPQAALGVFPKEDNPYIDHLLIKLDQAIKLSRKTPSERVKAGQYTPDQCTIGLILVSGHALNYGGGEIINDIQKCFLLMAFLHSLTSRLKSLDWVATLITFAEMS